MHILHITPAFSDPANGMAAAVREACAGLHARGVTVTVATVEDAWAALRSAPPPAVFSRRRRPGFRSCANGSSHPSCINASMTLFPHCRT